MFIRRVQTTYVPTKYIPITQKGHEAEVYQAEEDGPLSTGTTSVGASSGWVASWPSESKAASDNSCGGIAQRLTPMSCKVRIGVGGGISVPLEEELRAVEGISLGLSLDAVGPVSESDGTLNPSYLVDLVLRQTSVVSRGEWALERRPRAVVGPVAADRTWASPKLVAGSFV